MWHPEQTWSVLHDERHAALRAPQRTVEKTGEKHGPSGPEPLSHRPRSRQPETHAVSAPVLVAARVRRALARLVTA